jgi:hypothetical protein
VKQLRHLYVADDEARIVAAEQRQTWEDAVAAYFARRRRSLEAEYATKASFDRAALRCQAKALPDLLKLLTQGVMSASSKVIDREDGETSEDHIIRLSSLLTPPGWEQHVRPILEARRAEAMTKAFAEEDEEQNVALITEIDYLLRFLAATSTKGAEARAQRRARSPRDNHQRYEAAM